MGNRKKIVVIGSGFAGLSAATLLAKYGHSVTILEKNDQPGGRARIWQKDGFVFDMGPSWYWMPEVFEQYYQQFDKAAKDFYELKRLDPAYRIYFAHEHIDVPASMEELVQIFECKEPGSGARLREFLLQAEDKYKTAMSDYVHRVCNSFTEFIDVKLLIKSLRLNLFRSLRSEVRSRFTDPSLISWLEFPVLFLGSTPDKTPAMYSMMNYADLVLGTWYPMGGMNRIVQAMIKIANDNGVNVLLNYEVKSIEVKGKIAKRVHTDQGAYEADIVVAGSDYQHTEQFLLGGKHRYYDSDYWNSRTLSPSSLVFYVGVNKKLSGLLHHNLFFDTPFEQHAREIYSEPKWPSAPLFYVCAPSKTDPTVAPEGMENIFLLMPLASGLKDSEEMRRKYFDMMITRIEKKIGEPFRENIVVNRSYCLNDFEKDYNSFKGNAYGLANTLMQTAILKPKMVSPKVSNLFYTGQLTVPGPGVPPSIISGQIVAKEINKRISKQLI